MYLDSGAHSGSAQPKSYSLEVGVHSHHHKNTRESANNKSIISTVQSEHILQLKLVA